MPRGRTIYRCAECGGTSPRWVGRCPTCSAWSSLAEEVDAPSSRMRPVPAFGGVRAERALPLHEIDAAAVTYRPTGIGELDRVLGGGLVPGSVTLVGGEPGIGKSTLLLQAAAALATAGVRCLVVSAEESAQQVRLRAERLGTLPPKLWLLAETELAAVAGAVEEVGPELLIVDSIQTVHDPELGSPAGSVTQVRGCAAALSGLAKGRGMACVLVGHVTKDGDLAGPRVLEHLVDTVLSFEGDRHHSLRLLRARKHRFGPTTELGLFEMAEAGLADVPDAGALFLADRRPGVPGSAVVPTLDGHRPLLIELQGLVSESAANFPRRSAQGLDAGRLAMLIAVLHRRADINLSQLDVYALAAGGVRIDEPAADVATALALASSHLDTPLPADVVACGELGLGGELRSVGQMERRLTEAARLGFSRALVPESWTSAPAGIALLRAATLADALALVGISAGDATSGE